MRNPYISHSHTRFTESTMPFSRAMGSNTKDGTYGCIVVDMGRERGVLYLQVFNADEGAWWMEFLREYREVVSLHLIPAADQREENLPFSPPEFPDGQPLTLLDMVIR